VAVDHPPPNGVSTIPEPLVGAIEQFLVTCGLIRSGCSGFSQRAVSVESIQTSLLEVEAL
jgi:hypothetical protein